MAEERPTQDTIERMHRWFAKECNNRAWALASQPSRTPMEDRELLDLAHASSFHWAHAGTPLNLARADVLLAHVHALMGDASGALAHARRCLEFVTRHPCEDWDVAFAHAELAHAAAVAGDDTLHARHYVEARRLGEAIGDPEDRQVFLDEFTHVPEPDAQRLK